MLVVVEHVALLAVRVLLVILVVVDGGVGESCGDDRRGGGRGNGAGCSRTCGCVSCGGAVSCLGAGCSVVLLWSSRWCSKIQQ